MRPPRCRSLRGVLIAGWVAVVVSGLPPPLRAQVDCNANGEPDDLDIARGTSEDCDGSGVPDECEERDLSFALPVRRALSGLSHFLVVEDFDRDGHLDIAAANSTGEPLVTVIRNAGEGAFEPESYAVGESPRALRAADLSGDGAPDLAVLRALGFTVLVNAGDGLFDRRIEVSADDELSSLAVADLDADGATDVAVAGFAAERVTVFLNRGARFEPGAEVAVQEGVAEIAAADFDGDGRADLATLSKLTKELSVTLNEGAGGFSETRSVRLPVRGLPGKDLGGLAHGDLDGDGFEDLAVGLEGGFVVAKGGPRDLLALRVYRFFPGLADRLVLLDIDLDADLDVLYSFQMRRASGVGIVRNRGDGSFPRHSTQETVTGASGFAVGDLTRDGFPDLVRSFPGGWVLARQLGSTPSPVSFSRGVTTRYREWAQRAFLADVDADGDADLLTASLGRTGSISAWRNAGAGSFALMGRYQISVPGPFTDFGYVAPVDLDGDGGVELAVADPEPSELILLDFERVIVPGDRLPLPAPADLVEAADVDGDGNDDLLLVSRAARIVSLLFGPGIDGFRRRSSASLPESPAGLAVADLDGDADLDLAVASPSPPRVLVSLNAGGEFNDWSSHPVESAGDVVAADLDGDGVRDLVSFVQDGEELSVLWGLGAGAFTVPETVVLGRRVGRVRKAMLGGEDVLVAGGAILGGEERLFRELHSLESSIGIAGDLDGDGDEDVLGMGSSLIPWLTEPAAGGRPWAERICTPYDFHELSVAAPRLPGVARVTKFVVPADPRDPELLPPLFQNARRFPLHRDFLEEAFPDRFPALTAEFYDRLVNRRATREYFVGTVSLLESRDGPLYGFDILTAFLDDPAELPTVEEARGVYETLAEVFRLRPLAYAPASEAARESAAGWRDPGFPVRLGTAVEGASYEAYTEGAAVGRVRLVAPRELRALEEEGGISFQDILVLDEAPRDLEGIPAAIVTAAPQGVLSHLAIRTSRRGTPNAYLRGARARFGELRGKLVRLDVRWDALSTREATLEEAEAFWESRRRRISVLPEVDEEFASFPELLEVPLSDDVLPEWRFGGKASNFARLQQEVLTGEWSRYRERGFAIPLKYYLDFLRSNRLPSALDPARRVTYEEYIAEVAGDPAFESDSRRRFDALEALRSHMEDEGEVEEGLAFRLALRVIDVFEDDLPATARVRFRSSSNVEDALEFNGAGLYDSTSACAPDELDQDDRGPSRCDPSRARERGMTRALKRVWASLWNFRAWEERAFFSIPQERAAMGILVTRAFVDERVNGVAFTGNPANPLDRRWVVTAQAGEESVVRPPPGVVAEKNLLEVDVEDGRVVEIVRAEPSSLVPRGTFVLSDAELEELGRLLWRIDRTFPLDLQGYDRRQVVLDVEFKIDAGGRLAVKQVRPFLLSRPVPPAPTFALEIPPDTVACGAFVPSRSILGDYALKSTVRFRSGTVSLPTRTATFREELFEEVRLGPGKPAARPRGAGAFRVTRLEEGERTRYSFGYSQEFVLPGGGRYTVRLSGLDFHGAGDRALEPPRVLDEEALSLELAIEGEGDRRIFYSSCTFELFPERRIDVELEGGSSLSILERIGPPDLAAWIEPTRVVRADLVLGGVRREVSDYWHLAFSAVRHMRSSRYWVILEPPLELEGLERPAAAVELLVPDPMRAGGERVSFLDADFRILEFERALAYRRTELSSRFFLRGDATADGRVEMADAVFTLEHLFRSRRSLSCRKAADANDDGRVNLSDAVRILTVLFLGGEPLPAPSGEGGPCGVDPTQDDLTCEAYRPCVGG